MARKENTDGFFSDKDVFQALNIDDLENVAGGVVNYKCVDAGISCLKKNNFTKEQAKEHFKKQFYSKVWGPKMSSDGSEQDLEDILEYIDKKW